MNISYSLKYDLCTGCGICEDVCPANSIQIKQQNKEWRPKLNEETCINEKGCSRCFNVCPGVGIDIKARINDLYTQNTVKDKYAGRYVSLYSGHSNEEDLRYHAASGGVLSQFLIYLLEKKIIDGAVVTAFSDDDHITPLTYIAHTKEEVLNAKSSKYCPVSLNKVGNHIKNTTGKYVIVGLPCHIQGFRKRADIDAKFKKNVLGYFSIYCSSNRTFNAMGYIFNRYDVEKKKINYFAFRDEGCLGDMVIQSDKKVQVPYTSYYPSLRSFFKPKRCLTCIDHYGDLADVCFGDLHIKPYSEDKIGTSSWIVRTPFFNEFFIQAQQEGYISMQTLDVKTLNESQKVMLYPKKRKVKAVMQLDRLFGKKVAQYDVDLNETPSVKDYISVLIIHVQRFIGRHPKLWSLINLSNINRR